VHDVAVFADGSGLLRIAIIRIIAGGTDASEVTDDAKASSKNSAECARMGKSDKKMRKSNLHQHVHRSCADWPSSSAKIPEVHAWILGFGVA